MPCASAIVENIKTLSPEQEIGEVLEFFKSYHLENLPVVDKGGILLGYFSLHLLLKNLLPVSINVPNMPKLNPELTLKVAPGIAKRLKKTKPLKVADLMEREVETVHPETPLWEGIAKMIESRKAVMVVEQGTNRFLGMMNRHSALEELERMSEKEDASP